MLGLGDGAGGGEGGGVGGGEGVGNCSSGMDGSKYIYVKFRTNPVFLRYEGNVGICHGTVLQEKRNIYSHTKKKTPQLPDSVSATSHSQPRLLSFRCMYTTINR